MTKTVINQTWHIVCGSMEIEELEKYAQIKEWHPSNDRHSLFLMMKYPNTKFYRGKWGPEILYFSDDGPYRGKVGKMLLSYSRYREVADWFLKAMFQP